MYGTRLRALSIATLVTLAGGFALAAFYAPEDADQGFMQKILYLHTGAPRWDLRSYVAIHMSLIMGAGVLITGSIWARASWGHWWVWDEPTLVSFLIVFLLYATYQPLRFSIEDRDKQSRYASVFAITPGAFGPLHFLPVRMAQSYRHP